MKRIINEILLSAFISVIMLTAVEANVKRVYLTPHFHYDPVFEEDQNDYTDVGFDRVRRFLGCLEEDPYYAVVFSEIDYLKPFFDAFPEERGNILALIEENRIETGGSYSEPNEMSVGGEGIIRNIVYGRGYHEGVLGDKRAGVYMPFDVFGHTIQLSQILSKTRYKGIVWRKGNPPSEQWVGITVPGLPPDFYGLAPDGTTLHHRREHYKAVSGTASEQDLVTKVMMKIQTQQSLGLKADFGLLSSADFAYPEPWLAGNCEALRNRKPQIYISGPSAYFDAIAKLEEMEKSRLPVVARDFSLYHAGTALSRVNLKIGNRIGEEKLLGAEKLGVFASMMGAKYPEIALDKGWRQLLFNQHHDGITGTSCDRSYFDMMAGYREAVELGTQTYVSSAKFIASRVDHKAMAGNSQQVVVFNQLGWTRTDVVSADVVPPNPDAVSLLDSDGENVPFTLVYVGGESDFRIKFVAKAVPSVGYRSYYITETGNAAGWSSEGLYATGNTISNEYYSVTVDPARGGTIVGIKDLKDDREVISEDSEYPGNELIVLKEDKGPQYPAWELSTDGMKARSSDVKANVMAMMDGVTASIIVNGDMPGIGAYKQEIKLHRGIKRIDLLTTILSPAGTEDKAARNLWVVRFPAELKGTAPVIEDRFFAAARRRSLKPLEYKTDLEKMYTLSAPYSAMRWAEEGIAVRVDIKGDDDSVVNSVPLMLCEIVHTKKDDSVSAARKLQAALLQRGVTCTPSFDTEDRNKDLINRNFRFVIEIEGDNDFATVLLKGKESGDSFRKRVEQDGAGMVLVTHNTNDPDINKVDTLVIGSTSKDEMRKIIDELTNEITENMRITIKQSEDARDGVVAAIPDDYGIALINNGTLLHSFDNNGTIVMGLFHNAPWAQTNMGMNFSFPEEKNHRFTYALYPHAGDWRDADTYRVGHEFNAPLLAVTTENDEKGNLENVASFVDLKSDSTALIAVKAAGNPLAAMKTAEVAGPHNGIVIRMYEAEGKKDSVSLGFKSRPVSAVKTNMLEEPLDDGELQISDNGEVNFEIGPNEILTLLVKLEGAEPPAADTEPLARESEGAETLYSNYWDYNLGAAYMGNSPVSVTLGYPIEKKLPDPKLVSSGFYKPKADKIHKGENKLRLTYANNSADERLTGVLKVDAPEGWTSEPSEINLDLAPLEGKTMEVTVNATSPKKGYVRATLSTDDLSVFDVVAVGEKDELDATASYSWEGEECGHLDVTVNNNQFGRIDGTVTPIGPVETWPWENAGDYSLVEIEPGITNFILDEGEKGDYRFSICDTEYGNGPRHFWNMVKITYNGEYKYIPVVFNSGSM